MDSVSSLVNMPKRHYKKDSRFTNDLYTLTYDDNESLDTVELLSVFNTTVSSIYIDNCLQLIWVMTIVVLISNEV